MNTTAAQRTSEAADKLRQMSVIARENADDEVCAEAAKRAYDAFMSAVDAEAESAS